MNAYLPAVAISAAILVVLVVRAIVLMRRETDAPRGSLPGKGHHIIDASYLSGGGGGGRQASFRVPRDPQEYAKGFVPRQKDK